MYFSLVFLKDENQHGRVYTAREGLYNETRLPTTEQFELQSWRENEEGRRARKPTNAGRVPLSKGVRRRRNEQSAREKAGENRVRAVPVK